MKPIQAGLIGYGLSGQVFHAPFLQSLSTYELSIISTSKTSKVKEDLGDIHVVSNPDEVIHNEDLDLVIITAPNEYHYPLAKKALQAGKHVVVEKPFVVEANEGKELDALAKEKGLILSPYHNRRWDNDFLTIQSLIEQDELGEVMSYEAHFDRYRPHVRDRWRENPVPGAGVLYDLGSHLIDQAIHLFGTPNQVQGGALAQREGATVDDYFHVILQYDRLQVILHSSSLVRSPGPKFQVHGTKGSYIKDGADPQEEQLKNGLKPGDQGWGIDQKTTYGVLTNDHYPEGKPIETVVGRYEFYYEQLAEAIRSNGTPPVTAEEGTTVIELIEELKKETID